MRPSCPFLLKVENLLKKAEKGFDFSPVACKLLFRIAFLTLKESDFVLISSFVSAKGNENPPSLRNLLRLNLRNQHRKHCVFVFCWAFFRRFSRRFLAGPSLPRMGKRPAFFMSERDLVRIMLPVRGHSVPAQLFIQHMFHFCRKTFSPAAASCLSAGIETVSELSPQKQDCSYIYS